MQNIIRFEGTDTDDYENFYGNFETRIATDAYEGIDAVLMKSENDVYGVLSHAAIYAGAIALLGAFVMLAWNHARPKAVAESKERIVKICLIVIFIGCLSVFIGGIVNVASSW